MDVIWRFTMSVDIGDSEMFESCFTDPMLWDLSNNPVHFTGGPADKGPAEFTRSEFVQRAFGVIGSEPSIRHFVQHCVNNPLITFTAENNATVFAHLRNPFHDKTQVNGTLTVFDHMVAGLYHIDTARENGRWRICACPFTYINPPCRTLTELRQRKLSSLKFDACPEWRLR